MKKHKKGIIIVLCVLLCLTIVCVLGYKIMSEGGHRPFFYFNSFTVKAAYCDYSAREIPLTDDETAQLLSVLRSLKIGDRSTHTYHYFLIQCVFGGPSSSFRIKLITGESIYIKNYYFDDFC